MEAPHANKGDSQKIEMEVAEETNKILAGITECVERGEGKGKCHIFIDHRDICQCGKIDLNKYRMQ